MIQEHYYGMNFQIIPQNIIACRFPLENHDVIESVHGVRLKYYEKYKGFAIITADPSDYLSNDQIYSKWKKI